MEDQITMSNSQDQNDNSLDETMVETVNHESLVKRKSKRLRKQSVEPIGSDNSSTKSDTMEIISLDPINSKALKSLIPETQSRKRMRIYDVNLPSHHKELEDCNSSFKIKSEEDCDNSDQSSSQDQAPAVRNISNLGTRRVAIVA